MNKPLVSFLIALYNKEKYIKECIDSCLNQDYSNVEVCVVDDGSTDNSLDIVLDNYGSNSKVKIYSFAKNKGKVPAYNKAFELSSGDCFAFVGADDVNTPNRVSVLLDELISMNCNLTYGNLLQTDEQLNIVKKFDGISDKISYKRILKNNFISGGCSLFDNQLAKQVFPIQEKIKFEDWWVSLLAVLSFKVAYVNYDVGLYRLNDSNDNLSSDADIGITIENNKRLYKRDFVVYDALLLYLKSYRVNYKIENVENYILLNRIFKQNYLEPNFMSRCRNFCAMKLFVLDRWYFETILITILGSQFDFYKKKIKKIINK